MAQRLNYRLTLGIFGSAIFVSAFLLFQVQPIIGKFILPWFGGSPGVWTTCMLFFQVMLFAGYSYAHLLNRWLSIRRQIILHCGLLVLAVLLLPITPGTEWKPSGAESPTWLILALLCSKIGLPYFLLSATGPLLQSWLGNTRACESPYRLYALSNVGSMLALLTFPFLIEPSMSSMEQSAAWSYAFVAFAVLCSLSGWVLYQAEQRSGALDKTQTTCSVNWSLRLVWFSLPGLACVLLLSTTNQICLDAGSIPFLWIAPLTVYLLSFILTFDSHRWYNRRVFIMLAAIAYILLYLCKLWVTVVPLPLEVGLSVLGLFAGCMVCHGELVAAKPEPPRMTEFYLTLSAGGACGGLFVGLVAPKIFSGYFEWQLGLISCILLFGDLYLQSTEFWRSRVTAGIKVVVVTTVLVSATAILSFRNSADQQVLVVKRNFYGVLSVNRRLDSHSGEILRDIVHGRIIHGSQWEHVDRKMQPTSYYTPETGIGLALSRHEPDQPRRIGVVGLGAGTLATYGKPGDTIRFYEINPDVIEFAQDHFSFLSHSQAKTEVVLGDARLMLEREAPQNFDVLVLDAFSGDAIPVHLLTHEAMRLYNRHVKPEGVIAFHISNHYFDLKPVISGLAEVCGYRSAFVRSKENPSHAALRSLWVLLSRNPATIAAISDQSSTEEPDGQLVHWTDDRNNLFEALR